jgi:hypothetical protein
MTLEAAFKDMSERWQALHERLEQDLLWAALETKPDEEHSLASRYVDGITDLVAEARQAAADSRGLAVGPPSVTLASRGMLAAQRHFTRVARRLSADLLAYSRLRKLRRFGRERGGAWKDWAGEVHRALERCRQPLADLDAAMLQCWEELAERVGMTVVSVQTSGVGQQFNVPAGAEAPGATAG